MRPTRGAVTASAPTELAEAPPLLPAHPAVIDRLTKDMAATANVLDATDARAFAADDAWAALQHLRTSVEKLSDEAELHRPTLLG